jgi:hypothetical protein
MKPTPWHVWFAIGVLVGALLDRLCAWVAGAL